MITYNPSMAKLLPVKLTAVIATGNIGIAGAALALLLSRPVLSQIIPDAMLAEARSPLLAQILLGNLPLGCESEMGQH